MAVGGKGGPVDRTVISVARTVGRIPIEFPPSDESAFELATISQLPAIILTHGPKRSIRSEE